MRLPCISGFSAGLCSRGSCKLMRASQAPFQAFPREQISRPVNLIGQEASQEGELKTAPLKPRAVRACVQRQPQKEKHPTDGQDCKNR